MSKIQLIADTGCDLPDELIEKYNIHLIPVNVHFGERIYQDRMELSAEQFYQLMKTAPAPPTTSQINPDQYLQAFKQYTDQDVDILVIGLSLKLTGSLQSAQMSKTCLEMIGFTSLTQNLLRLAKGCMCCGLRNTLPKVYL